MILYLSADTKIQDVVIDFIEIRLPNGVELTLDWDESDISRSPSGFCARYKGVYFNNEYANNQLHMLENGFQILEVRLYSEEDGCENKEVVITEMEFYDDGVTQLFEPMFVA